MAQDNAPPKPTRDAPPGFAAEVSGASLADLIQINCLTRARAAFEVRSQGRLGYLFFDAGQLVHAELGLLRGERAVASMLSLQTGTFRPSDAPWPTEPTIECSYEAVLLRAAQQLDELGRKPPAAGVKTMPTKPVGELPPRPNPSLTNSSQTNPSQTSPSLTSPTSRLSNGPTASLSSVHLDRSGVLVTSRGPQAEAIAETTAFVGPLANRISEELGLGNAVGIDIEYANDKAAAFFREPTGAWIGAHGSSSELFGLRKRIEAA